MMTLDAAVAQARRIQRDLDAGRLKVPYPPAVLAELDECCQVFAASPDAGEVMRRLEAQPAKAMALPW